MVPGAAGVGEPARGLHDLRLGQSPLSGLPREPSQVGGQQRRERGVERGGGGALVLAKGAHQLAGQRQRRAGEQLADLLPQQPLVGRVGVGVQQAHRHRLGLEAREHLCQLARVGGLERQQDPLRGDPLAGAEAQLGLDQRRGSGLAEPVQVGAVLAAELDHVLEAGRRDQRRARRVSLQQRVRRDRHPVGEALHLCGSGPGGGEYEAYRLEHALRLRGGRGGDLRRVRPAVPRDEDRVGEGAPDIHAQ